jgi:ankyrin repeat protein
MLAARHGDERTVSLLLERGADPALTNPEGAIAADYARVAGRERLAARLEALGRKPAAATLPTAETPK